MIPFFTVVIPAFNSAAFLPETIASLAAQTFRSFEVVVIDDNSNDNTAAIAMACLQASGLSYQVVSKPAHVPQGVSHSRNMGIQMAKGEWIAFLDSDDFFAPQKLATLHQVIMQQQQPMLLHHSLEWVEERTLQLLGNSLHQSEDGWLQNKDRIFQENFIGTSSVCLPKKVLEAAGYFDASLHGVEDYYMWMWVSVQYPIYYINQLLGKYRMRQESLLAGRKFSYYLWQNGLLVNRMREGKVFHDHQVQAVNHYMLGSLLEYYAVKSIQQHGIGQFLRSFPQLFKLRPVFAFQLYAKIGKGQLMQRLFKNRTA